MAVRRSSHRWHQASRLAVVLAIPVIVSLAGIVAPAWGQPAGAQPEPPASISLEIVDGSAQDLVHAQYRPGQQVRLTAVVRDALGRPTNAPCTRVYEIANDRGPNQDLNTPDQNVRGWIDPVQNDVLHFGDRRIPPGNTTGAFSVSVHCAENPQITSAGRNEAPYRFETTNARFAPPVGPPIVEPPPAPAPPPPAEPPAPPKKAASGGALGLVLLAGLVVGGGYYLGKTLGANEDDCSCSCSDGTTCTAGSSDCGTSGGVAIPCGCPVAGDSFGCDGRGGKARLGPGSQTIHDVRELVALGLVDPREDDRCAGRPRAIGPRDRASHPVRELVRRPMIALGARVATGAKVPEDRNLELRGPHVRLSRSATAATATTASGLVATSKPGRTASAATTSTVTRAPTNPTASHGPEITAAQVGTALAITITAYAWISWLRDRRQEAPSVKLLPWVQPDAGGVNVTGHF